MIFRSLVSLGLILVLTALPAGGKAREEAPPTEKAGAQVEALAQVLTEESADLEKEVGALQIRVISLKEALAHVEKELVESRDKAAALKASMILRRLSEDLAQTEIESYSIEETEVASRLEVMSGEIEIWKGEQASREASMKALELAKTPSESVVDPPAQSSEIRQALGNYLKWVTAQTRQTAQLVNSLDQERQLLEQRRALASEVKTELTKYVAETWKADLLKQHGALSWREHAAHLGALTAGLPERLHHRVHDAISALLNLGYPAVRAREALAVVRQQAGAEGFAAMRLEELLRQTLRALV